MLVECPIKARFVQNGVHDGIPQIHPIPIIKNNHTLIYIIPVNLRFFEGLSRCSLPKLWVKTSQIPVPLACHTERAGRFMDVHPRKMTEHHRYLDDPWSIGPSQWMKIWTGSPPCFIVTLMLSGQIFPSTNPLMARDFNVPGFDVSLQCSRVSATAARLRAAVWEGQRGLQEGIAAIGQERNNQCFSNKVWWLTGA